MGTEKRIYRHFEPECTPLLKDFGLTGYGIYTYLWNVMLDTDSSLPFTSLSSTAKVIETDKKIIEDVIKNYGLFEYNETHFWLPDAPTTE